MFLRNTRAPSFSEAPIIIKLEMGLCLYRHPCCSRFLPGKDPGSLFSGKCSFRRQRQLKPGEYLWYRTSLPQEACALPGGYRLLLHFGAVDYEAEITLNGHKAFCHRGGYLPFEVDITDFLRPDRNELVVRVLDHSNRTEQSRGKQSLERGGIFYTAQSGIWQTVWLEQVPSSYLKEVWFETDYDKRLVTAHVTALTTKTLPPFPLPFLIRIS